jgi:hypothetical protein
MTSLGSAILLNPLYLGFIFYGFVKTREDELLIGNIKDAD